MSIIVPSPDWFKLDGVLCDTKGLRCDTPPVPPMAKKRYTTFKYGGDEDGVFSDDSYENVRYALTCHRFPMSHTADYYDQEIFAWIQSGKILEVSRTFGYYFKIRTIDSITPTVRQDGMRIDYKIGFTLSPFRYLIDNEEIELGDTGGVAENPGTRYSKPIVRCQVLATPATITTNGETLTINKTGIITIDSDRMIVYKTEDNVNTAITQFTSGRLPMLSPGTNLIQGMNTGNITVVGNWRCY